MSIWSSIGGPDVVAIENTTEANYNPAATPPDVVVDVATAPGIHRHTRLACLPLDHDNPDAFEAELLLSLPDLEILIGKLAAARFELRRRTDRP